MSSVQQGASVFEVKSETQADDVVVLSVAGELDVSTVGELRSALTGALDRSVTRLVVDLARVTFIDSVSVAALVNAQRRLADSGRYALVVPEESYGRLIFQAGGIESVLPLFDSRDAALAHARA